MDLNLKDKEVFILDWDGTIIDSMEIKIENFIETLSKLIGLEINNYKFKSRIKSLYKKYSGLPREILFENILRDANIKENEIKYSNFNKDFSRLNKTNLLKAMIFKDAKSFINLLIKNNKKIFISSSVPQEELLFFTTKKLNIDLRKNIKGILGTKNNFSKGSSHIKYIETNTGYTRERFLFVGDDLHDYKLSREAEVDFILINRKLENISISNIIEINSLNELECLISG